MALRPRVTPGVRFRSVGHASGAPATNAVGISLKAQALLVTDKPGGLRPPCTLTARHASDTIGSFSSVNLGFPYWATRRAQ